MLFPLASSTCNFIALTFT